MMTVLFPFCQSDSVGRVRYYYITEWWVEPDKQIYILMLYIFHTDLVILSITLIQN